MLNVCIISIHEVQNKQFFLTWGVKSLTVKIIFKKFVHLNECKTYSKLKDANEFLVDVLTQVHDECDKLLREQYGIVDGAERRMRNPAMANFAFTIQSTIICDM